MKIFLKICLAAALFQSLSASAHLNAIFAWGCAFRGVEQEQVRVCMSGEYGLQDWMNVSEAFSTWLDELRPMARGRIATKVVFDCVTPQYRVQVSRNLEQHSIGEACEIDYRNEKMPAVGQIFAQTGDSYGRYLQQVGHVFAALDYSFSDEGNTPAFGEPPSLMNSSQPERLAADDREGLAEHYQRYQKIRHTDPTDYVFQELERNLGRGCKLDREKSFGRFNKYQTPNSSVAKGSSNRYEEAYSYILHLALTQDGKPKFETDLYATWFPGVEAWNKFYEGTYMDAVYAINVHSLGVYRPDNDACGLGVVGFIDTWKEGALDRKQVWVKKP